MRVLSDGRIRRTASEWRALVKQFEASDQSEAGFCRAKKLSSRSFREWRKRLDAAEAASGRPRARPKPKAQSAGFVELAAPSTGSDARSGAEFELELPGGVRLRWRA